MIANPSLHTGEMFGYKVTLSKSGGNHPLAITDLATMEAANEAARRAVNAILDESGSSAERCKVWPMREPEISIAGWMLIDQAKTLRERAFARLVSALHHDSIELVHQRPSVEVTNGAEANGHGRARARLQSRLRKCASRSTGSNPAARRQAMSEAGRK